MFGLNILSAIIVGVIFSIVLLTVVIQIINNIKELRKIKKRGELD